MITAYKKAYNLNSDAPFIPKWSNSLLLVEDAIRRGTLKDFEGVLFECVRAHPKKTIILLKKYSLLNAYLSRIIRLFL